MNKLKYQTVLVTGGCGFTGSHMVEALLNAGHHVVIPYRQISPNSYLVTQQLQKQISLAPCDIRDFSAVQALFTTFSIDYVLHFAAQGSIPTDPNSYIDLIDSNVMGTTHVLEAAKRSGICQGFIMVSSDKAYGKKNTPYVETDHVGGDHPYEVSKAAGDLLARAYYSTFGLPVIVVRAGNIYGPGDLHLNRIIPSIIYTALTGKPLQLRSDGSFVRDYIYVTDVIQAYTLLLSQCSTHVGNVFHVSSDQAYSVLQLIAAAETALKRPIPYIITNTAVNEIPFQHLNCEAIHALGWQPTISLQQGLQKTFAWYKKHKTTLWELHE